MRSAAAGAGEQLRRVSNMAERMWPAARQASHVVHAAVVRTWSRGVAGAMSASARPFSAFERQELGGFVVALVLSVAVAALAQGLAWFARVRADRVERSTAPAVA